MSTTTLQALASSPILAFISTMPWWVILLISVWTIVWKGLALWKASRLSHKKWFIFMLILNTAGILEIIYIFAVARKYRVETEESKEM